MKKISIIVLSLMILTQTLFASAGEGQFYGYKKNFHMIKVTLENESFKFERCRSSNRDICDKVLGGREIPFFILQHHVEDIEIIKKRSQSQNLTVTLSTIISGLAGVVGGTFLGGYLRVASVPNATDPSIGFSMVGGAIAGGAAGAEGAYLISSHVVGLDPRHEILATAFLNAGKEFQISIDEDMDDLARSLDAYLDQLLAMWT